MEPATALAAVQGLRAMPVRDQIAHEVIGLAYGFFSPLEGFMGKADVDAVVREMRLTSGYIWSIPIVFDIADEEISQLRLAEGETLLLTYQGQPLATLRVDEVYRYDMKVMAQQVYGTTDERHPGVRRTYACKDRFLGGPITLVNPPRINPPFDQFWYTPRQLHANLVQRGWSRVVAHQTRNVPYGGHEWLMKGAYFAANADAVLVNAVIGEKRNGDYIDEAIVLGHDMLRRAGYFREEIHLTSILLWDMRYAGPREAVFHAIVRKNLGCTHHMFGRDHAGVGTYYDPYAAHQVFAQLPDLGITPVLTREWWYCPVCAGVASEELCGHTQQRQQFSGSLIRSILEDGVKPPSLIMRPEVFDVVMRCAEEYGFGSPFVTESYLRNRRPVLSMPALAPQVAK
ncbi:MAG: sulfate adenylyltransferase [Chloroflexi bacterium]|nr:sulfate adenylyltransferase [Chloroflexota bacterium]